MPDDKNYHKRLCQNQNLAQRPPTTSKHLQEQLSNNCGNNLGLVSLLLLILVDKDYCLKITFVILSFRLKMSLCLNLFEYSHSLVWHVYSHRALLYSQMNSWSLENLCWLFRWKRTMLILKYIQEQKASVNTLIKWYLKTKIKNCSLPSSTNSPSPTQHCPPLHRHNQGPAWHMSFMGRVPEKQGSPLIVCAWDRCLCHIIN